MKSGFKAVGDRCVRALFEGAARLWQDIDEVGSAFDTDTWAWL